MIIRIFQAGVFMYFPRNLCRSAIFTLFSLAASAREFTGQSSDSDLLEKISSGDEAAFEVLYARYKALIFSLALHILGDRGNAEEVSLDTFTKIWTQADLYDSRRASAKTWLISMARHQAIDRLRKSRCRPDQDQRNWAEEALDALPGTHNPETETVLHDLRRKIQNAIGQLPPEQRAPLALAYFNGLTHSEIAHQLQQPLGTIKTRIRSAILNLQQQFS